MDKVRIMVYLPPKTKIALKIRAAQENRSMSDIVEKAINIYLAQDPAD